MPPTSPEALDVPTRKLHLGRAALLVAVLLGLFFFTLTGSVRCGFAMVTHHPCPGCGTTRSILALLRLDVLEALRMNPVGPFVVGVLAALAARGVWLMARDGNVRLLGQGIGMWLTRALLAGAVLQMIVWALRFFGLFGGPVPV